MPAPWSLPCLGLGLVLGLSLGLGLGSGLGLGFDLGSEAPGCGEVRHLALAAAEQRPEVLA